MVEKIDYSEYTDSYIAFIDILGFSDRIKNIKTEDDFNKISQLLLIIRKTAEYYTSENQFLHRFEATSISDSIIISVPVNQHPFSLITLIQILLAFQYDLMLLETPIRGYITKGKIYHKQNILFGQGFIDAYVAESKLKGPPRIAIDPKIINKALSVLEKNSKEIKTNGLLSIFDFIREDPSDGLYFIDYLSMKKISNIQYRDNLNMNQKTIESFIMNQLSRKKDDISIYRKFKWLNWYANVTRNEKK